MATNFGTKIARNAHKCISTRDNKSVIIYNGVFMVDQSKEDISDSKGLIDVAMSTPNLHQNRQKYHKNGHNFGCMQYIHAEFGFETGFVLSRNSSVTLPFTRDKGALPRQTILGLKLLEMHFCER